MKPEQVPTNYIATKRGARHLTLPRGRSGAGVRGSCESAFDICCASSCFVGSRVSARDSDLEVCVHHGMSA